MGKSGRKIQVIVRGDKEYSADIKLTGRPICVFWKFIELCELRGYFDRKMAVKAAIYHGFKHGRFDSSLISELIEFGFDHGYWDDSKIFGKPFEYWLKDKNWTKEERVKEFEKQIGENNESKAL